MSSLPDVDELDQAVDQTVAGPFLGVAPKTLANWRHQGCGPVYFKINGAVRYSLRDLTSWRTARRRRSTSDPGGGP